MEIPGQYITWTAGLIAPGDIINPDMKLSAQGQENLVKNRKRSRRRKLTLIGFLTAYALMGWLRLQGALTYREYFESIDFRPGSVYLAITGGAIGFLFSMAIILLVINSRIGVRFSRWLASIFIIWFWIDRIWLSTREAFFNQLGISLLVTTATLFWAFVLIRKRDMLKSVSSTLFNEGLPAAISDAPAFSGEEQHVKQT
jgi:predicted nucleic acid-binding Zn ribbon protein